MSVVHYRTWDRRADAVPAYVSVLIELWAEDEPEAARLTAAELAAIQWGDADARTVPYRQYARAGAEQAWALVGAGRQTLGQTYWCPAQREDEGVGW